MDESEKKKDKEGKREKERERKKERSHTYTVWLNRFIVIVEEYIELNGERVYFHLFDLSMMQTTVKGNRG